MYDHLEFHRDSFTIRTDPDRLNIDAIAELLSRAYWATMGTRENLEHALNNSLVFSLYDEANQIGLARVVTDYGIFAYLCDVFIHEDYRGQGLGKWLLEAVHSHSALQGLRRWLLATRNAHGLYKKFEWTAMKNPDRWMERFHG